MFVSYPQKQHQPGYEFELSNSPPSNLLDGKCHLHVSLDSLTKLVIQAMQSNHGYIYLYKHIPLQNLT